MGLIAHAFAHPEVARVIAETLPDLFPSIGVLRKIGFSYVGEGSEPGVVRYGLRRVDTHVGRSSPPNGGAHRRYPDVIEVT